MINKKFKMVLIDVVDSTIDNKEHFGIVPSSVWVPSPQHPQLNYAFVSAAIDVIFQIVMVQRFSLPH